MAPTEDPITAAARVVETIRAEYETLNNSMIPDDVEARIQRKARQARLGIELEVADNAFYAAVTAERAKVLGG